MHRQRTFLVLATLATTTATSAWGQAESSAVGPTGRAVQAASPIPDFSGPWSHPFLPGFEPPQTGPGPVVNKARVRQVFGDDLRRLPATQNVLVSNPALLVGDYTNPILKPEAAEIVRKLGEISLSGRAFPSPFNQCWPLGLPFVFENLGTEIIQQPGKVTILYPFNHEFRQVRLNERQRR